MCGRQCTAVECRPRSRATSAQSVAPAIVGGTPGETVRLGHGTEHEKDEGGRGKLFHAETSLFKRGGRDRLRAAAKTESKAQTKTVDCFMLGPAQVTRPLTLGQSASSLHRALITHSYGFALSITRHAVDQMAELAERLERLERMSIDDGHDFGNAHHPPGEWPLSRSGYAMRRDHAVDGDLAAFA
jgi:hypothetical protein